MFQKKSYLILIAFILLIINSCSEYQKVLKSTDYNLKYEKAIEYYEEEDYYRALSLLEELVSLYRGSERAERIAWM